LTTSSLVWLLTNIATSTWSFSLYLGSQLCTEALCQSSATGYFSYQCSNWFCFILIWNALKKTGSPLSERWITMLG
jgi:hypothetical protein